ncbi:sensor histidine kinase [Microbacterium paludicola]|uniref:sensor histidine kinase n=1 Tax=Microbacterium paludicola TaxID=300019 RepID=UPI000903CA62|nr:ATP-binding protein [Microbacterium paludicola]APF32889.1 two-component sensor histidine kinase [Microbacterium paludicola]
MNPTQLALVALLGGVFVGLLISAVAFLAWRARVQAQEQADGDLPAGARDVLAALDEAALIVDASFTIVATSPSAELFGLFEGETVPGDELRELLRSSRGVAHSETGTLRLRRGVAPAEPRLIVARASSITPRFTLVLVRDITERERLAEMRRDFVANTSHELKTPVGAVTLLAEAIESAADDPEQVRSFASRLSAEAMRLGNLTSRIMSLSRLQSSDELTELRDVAIDEVVTSAIETHAIAAESAGVALVRGGDRGLYVRGDVQVLSEAVGNLIANAIVYSPPASQVGVGIRGTGDTVEIAVTDRGIGIPESEQQRVFERFYRADYARSRRTGGTGLGLSIVKHAVQRHGGEVQLWSRPGRGSTFTIRLPAIAAPDGAAAVPRKTRKKIVRAMPARPKGDPS